MNNLYLVATNHRDTIYGPDRLREFYSRVRPDMILNEESKEDMGRLKGMFDEARGKLEGTLGNNSNIGKFIEMYERQIIGFEHFVNKEYAEKKNIPNLQIDLPYGMQKQLDGIEKIMKKMVLKIKTEADFNEKLSLLQEWDRYGSNSKKIWKNLSNIEGKWFGEIPILVARFKGVVGKRDEYMVEKIRELYDPNKVIVSTSGMLHMVDSLSKSSLYSKIKDLNPVRVPIIG
jgi:hypothetical protein